MPKQCTTTSLHFKLATQWYAGVWPLCCYVVYAVPATNFSCVFSDFTAMCGLTNNNNNASLHIFAHAIRCVITYCHQKHKRTPQTHHNTNTIDGTTDGLSRHIDCWCSGCKSHFAFRIASHGNAWFLCLLFIVNDCRNSPKKASSSVADHCY